MAFRDVSIQLESESRDFVALSGGGLKASAMPQQWKRIKPISGFVWVGEMRGSRTSVFSALFCSFLCTCFHEMEEAIPVTRPQSSRQWIFIHLSHSLLIRQRCKYHAKWQRFSTKSNAEKGVFGKEFFRKTLFFFSEIETGNSRVWRQATKMPSSVVCPF